MVWKRERKRKIRGEEKANFTQKNDRKKEN
jgi:hypothetical protein